VVEISNHYLKTEKTAKNKTMPTIIVFIANINGEIQICNNEN
jgi:hypothetical protein